ncbi:DUF4230 domain-containing protein [Sporosarcina thermotolerans]|uniref:DUF4230 domain-containing protein n=1 Tax=Sporosarcina thermotolerans TaxID=633404 RepID=A0AAW9A5I2_9BACL|nr:DUF4230 domain-containing protein [Sporosarcina thermotolerans]MDW0116447.1 DUF4230 domain-containing protein [Sporosarcina thermotolerans]WHT48392.1 DUF4230 domain-containing protein [Sporosarcina thermotolerans]
MEDKKKLQEIERLLKELKASEAESAVTVEEALGRKTKPRPKSTVSLWRVTKMLLFGWKRSIILIAVILLLAFISVPFIAFQFLKQGSTFTEQKGVFLEQIMDLNEMATAEAFTKVIVERQDNQLFGQSIGMNLPGTKRQLLVVIPGSVKAGVDMSKLAEKDVIIDEKNKTAKLFLPPAIFLGGAEIYFDEVEVYSYEGVFRTKANIDEAYELAAEAKTLILEEATGQGVLKTAEFNAEKTLKEMFSFAGYDVTIEFKE